MNEETHLILKEKYLDPEELCGWIVWQRING